MVKYFAKDSRKEVNEGDILYVTLPIDTPYGKTVTKMTIKVTEKIIPQLLKDGFIYKEEIDEATQRIMAFKPYIRKLARKAQCTFDTALDFLAILQDVSPTSVNRLLIDMMTQVMNKGKECGDHYYVIQSASDGTYHSREFVDIFGSALRKDIPVFYDKDDAKRAADLLNTFCRIKNEQKD